MPSSPLSFSRVPVLLLHNIDPLWEHSERDEALRHARELEAGLASCGHPVTVVEVNDSDLRRRLAGYSPHEYVVLNACESLPGLDRSEHVVAAELSAMGYAYTGSGPEALALSWDKLRVKRLLASHGIPTPRYRLFQSTSSDGWSVFPAIVKPVYEHCSLGATRESVVLDARELRARVEYVLDTFHQPALVEDFIDGREFHVSVWGAEELEVLPPAEMDLHAFTDIHDRLCTYDSKFVTDSPAYEAVGITAPALLSAEESASVGRVSRGAFRAVGCQDYARMDLRLRDGIFNVLDVNPNADIQSGNSTACSAAAAGYSYGVMASRLVALAARRHPRFNKHLVAAKRPDVTPKAGQVSPSELAEGVRSMA